MRIRQMRQPGRNFHHTRQQQAARQDADAEPAHHRLTQAGHAAAGVGQLPGDPHLCQRRSHGNAEHTVLTKQRQRQWRWQAGGKTFAGHPRQRLGPHRHAAFRCRGIAVLEQDQVQLAGGERLAQVRRRPGAQCHAHARKERLETPHHRWKDMLHQLLRNAEAQRAGGGALRHAGVGLVIQPQDLAGIGDQQHALGRRTVDPPLDAFQQGLAERFLEPADLQAHGRLRAPEPLRGGRETRRLVDGDQRTQSLDLQMPSLHNRISVF